MNPTTLAAALAGAGAAGGVVCLVAYGVGASPPRGTPPPRWRTALRKWQMSRRTAVAAVVAGLATFAVTGWPVAGLAAVPAVITIPRIVSRRPVRARVAKLEALESWVRRVSDVLAASRGLEDALTHSAEYAATAIAGPVQELATKLRTRSTTTDEALRAFADQVDDPVGDLIATALMLAADRRGPGLGAVLNELAADVAAEVGGRRAVEAERAAYRSALTWIMVFVLGWTIFVVVNRSYSAPFSTPVGQFVLAVVAACYAGGLYWLHRLGGMIGPQRIFQTSREQR